MPEETIRKYLRAALDVALTAEKSRLHKFYDDSDANRATGIKMMEPIIDALNALKAEVDGLMFLEVEVTSSVYGDEATINLGNWSGLEQSLSISTTAGNTRFEVKNFQPGMSSYVKDFESAEDVLKLVLDAAGHHIAMRQVLDERKK